MEENKEENVVKQESTTQEESAKTAEVVTGTQATPTKKVNSFGLASFICSLIGLVVCGLPLGIAAVITGINGLSSFKPEQESGKWMAITGLCLGIVDVISVIVYLTVMQNYY